MADREPVVNSRVKLINLVDRPDLNGQEGTVLSISDGNRAVIQFDTGKKKSIKFSYLECLDPIEEDPEDDDEDVANDGGFESSDSMPELPTVKIPSRPREIPGMQRRVAGEASSPPRQRDSPSMQQQTVSEESSPSRQRDSPSKQRQMATEEEPLYESKSEARAKPSSGSSCQLPSFDELEPDVEQEVGIGMMERFEKSSKSQLERLEKRLEKVEQSVSRTLESRLESFRSDVRELVEDLESRMSERFENLEARGGGGGGGGSVSKVENEVALLKECLEAASVINVATYDIAVHRQNFKRVRASSRWRPTADIFKVAEQDKVLPVIFNYAGPKSVTILRTTSTKLNTKRIQSSLGSQVLHSALAYAEQIEHQDERRADPMNGGQAVTYYEMCSGMAEEKLTETELKSYWTNLKVLPSQTSNKCTERLEFAIRMADTMKQNGSAMDRESRVDLQKTMAMCKLRYAMAKGDDPVALKAAIDEAERNSLDDAMLRRARGSLTGANERLEAKKKLRLALTWATSTKYDNLKTAITNAELAGVEPNEVAKARHVLVDFQMQSGGGGHDGDGPRKLLHFMADAKPTWTASDLKSACSKLKSVGITTVSELTDALSAQGESSLGAKMRAGNVKTFAQGTLDALKKHASSGVVG